MKSPCINKCRIKDEYCQGCYRTRSEIAQWSSYTDKQKSELIEKLKTRQVKK